MFLVQPFKRILSNNQKGKNKKLLRSVIIFHICSQFFSTDFSHFRSYPLKNGSQTKWPFSLPSGNAPFTGVFFKKALRVLLAIMENGQRSHHSTQISILKVHPAENGTLLWEINVSHVFPSCTFCIPSYHLFKQKKIIMMAIS